MLVNACKLILKKKTKQKNSMAPLNFPERWLLEKGSYRIVTAEFPDQTKN